MEENNNNEVVKNDNSFNGGLNKKERNLVWIAIGLVLALVTYTLCEYAYNEIFQKSSNTNITNNTENTNNNNNTDNNDNGNNTNSNNNDDQSYDEWLQKYYSIDNHGLIATGLEKYENDIYQIMYKVRRYHLYDLGSETVGELVTVDKNELTDNMLRSMLLSSLNAYKSGITKEEADEYFKNSFGFVPAEYRNIICEVEKEALFKYDSEKQMFIENDYSHGHDGPNSGFTDYYVSDYKEDGSLRVVSAYFYKEHSVINGDDINHISVPYTIDSDLDTDELIQLFRNNISSITNIPVYELTFEKVGNEFYFKSIILKK